MPARPAAPSRRIAAIGEGMVELSEAGDGLVRLGYAGDTLNAAVYLARALRGRAGLPALPDAAVDYVTVLGDDPYSDGMAALMREEGVGTGLVDRLPGALPGLYAIRTDEAGERSFFYWRSAAAARQLFRTPGGAAALEALAGYDLVYASGITLAILRPDQRRDLCDLMAAVRRQGGWAAFDSNVRLRLWADRAEARDWIDEAWRAASHALPTLDDERLLAGEAGDDASADTVLDRLHGLGVAEIALKQGADGCTVSSAEGRTSVPAAPVDEVVDTTAAGDSFNAAYLAARLGGAAPAEAARAGHRLAARVVGHRGAIVPADAGDPGPASR